MSLNTYLPERGITIISGFKNSNIHAFVAAYSLKENNSVKVVFPKGHSFVPGQKVTLHLDNRTGVDQYDADLRVYRTSYRGTVKANSGNEILVQPDEYMLFYSDQCVLDFKSEHYVEESFEVAPRALPKSDVTLGQLHWNEKENENKLGVLITSMNTRPHTSLMAFLSNEEDDVFLITFKGTFKSKVLHQNNSCCFAIDHRSEYNFEKALDWNYTVISADVYEVDEKNPAYSEIKYHFVEKNPWEATFFLSPEIEMFHVKPKALLLPECLL